MGIMSKAKERAEARKEAERKAQEERERKAKALDKKRREVVEDVKPLLEQLREAGFSVEFFEGEVFAKIESEEQRATFGMSIYNGEWSPIDDRRRVAYESPCITVLWTRKASTSRHMFETPGDKEALIRLFEDFLVDKVADIL